MKTRCLNPKAPNYSMYGGAGITVCERWLESFENFLQDMGERPKGTTIDRIDGKQGYEPSNCRWATAKEQQRNVRSNVIVTFRGETKTLPEWADIVGIPLELLRQRLMRRGYTPEQAFTKPVRAGSPAAPKTHCKRGHSYDGPWCLTKANGQRCCMVCKGIKKYIRLYEFGTPHEGRNDATPQA